VAVPKPEPIEMAPNTFQIPLSVGQEPRECRVIRHPAGTRAHIELDSFVVTITFKPAAIRVALDDFDFELHY
jgi:hypothetical protein